MFELAFQHALKENTTPHDIGTNSNLCKVLSRSRPTWLFSRLSTFDSTADFHLFQAIWDLLGNSSQSAAELYRSKQTLQKYNQCEGQEVRKTVHYPVKTIAERLSLQQQEPACIASAGRDHGYRAKREPEPPASVSRIYNGPYLALFDQKQLDRLTAQP